MHQSCLICDGELSRMCVACATAKTAPPMILRLSLGAHQLEWSISAARLAAQGSEAVVQATQEMAHILLTRRAKCGD